MSDAHQERYRQFNHEMEDFWHRRTLSPTYKRRFMLFGREVHLASNREPVLAAVDHSLSMFATVPAGVVPPLPAFQVQIGVHPARIPPEPPDGNLVPQLWYSGTDTWIMIHAGGWGHAYADLARRQAKLVLAPELADRPGLVSRGLLNTVLLNLCLGNGDGMLHASCLEREGRALMLLAPHNTGKSTTALRLVQHGFRLASDSMIHILPGGERPVLAGFPVGRIKLRGDMLPHFPQLRQLVETEQVRDETKFALDLRGFMPQRVLNNAFAADSIVFCLLSRNSGGGGGLVEQTSWSAAGTEEVWTAIMANSLYYDSPEIWKRNLDQIERVLAHSRYYHLRIGSDPAGILAAVEELWRA